MTTFEQPDANLLVEHLLPSLLGAKNLLTQEVRERNLFFGELGTALQDMHGRITIISSPPRGERVDSQYPWLWRYVGHFNVGSEVTAVQHAKLWAFHWRIDDEEALELRVSSTNLTSSAFKSQLQAGWQVTLPLGKRAIENRHKTWGSLVPFLQALGASAGASAAARLQRLVALLGRAECPAGVTFVASVPSEETAAVQLAKYKPSEIHVLTPTIGEWNEQTLAAWSKDVGGIDPKKIHLKWISETHPWVNSKGWSLSKPTAEILKSKIKLEHLPSDARFTCEHKDGDDRWSHAKLYLLRTKYKKKRLLLITSANWSPSAWGAGSQMPKNFELGVLLETDWTNLERLGTEFENGAVCFCSHADRRKPKGTLLQWAEVNWDGKSIVLHVRSTDSVVPINAVITFMASEEEIIPLVNGEASRPWTDANSTPLTARFTQGSEVLEINVVDLRPPSESDKTPLPEVDPAIEKALREGFLLQRYGGPVVDSDPVPRQRGKRRPAVATAPANDYAVESWNDARTAFAVVDKWRAALEAAVEPLLEERVRMDGENLRALFARREGPAAGLVAQELGWRLDGDS